SSITNRTSVGCEWRPARRYLPFNSISLAQSARTREGSRLGALLRSIHKPNSWSRLSDNCLEDRQSLASAGVVPSRWAVAGDGERITTPVKGGSLRISFCFAPNAVATNWASRFAG